MKNSKEEEVPVLYAERNPIILLTALGVSALFIFLTYYTVTGREAYEVNPYGFFLFIPTLVFSFQTLWLLLNPFAIFYKDKVEIKYSLLKQKFFFYVDIKTVGQAGEKTIDIVYNDNELERISFFGIKPKHKIIFREELLKQVNQLLEHRPDDKATSLSIQVIELKKPEA